MGCCAAAGWRYAAWGGVIRGATSATIRYREPIRTGIDPCFPGICLAGPQKGDRGRHARATQSDPGDRPFGHDHHRVSVFLRAAAHEGSAAAAGAAHRADGRDAAAAGGARSGKARAARRSCLARRGAHAGARDHGARRDRQRHRRGLPRAHRGAHRQSGAVQLSRDHRAGFAERAAAQPARRAERVLRRVRLGARRSGHRGARTATPNGRPTARRSVPEAGHAHLGQRRGSALHAHRRGRRALHVHDHPTGREHGRRAGLAPPLWPDQPLGHPGDARLLHPPRGPDRRPRRQAARDRLL